MSVLNLSCSICSQILRNVYEISGANCGHLFHAKCLSATQYNRNATRRCPKCQSYAPVMYKLYETPEEIANINALESKVQTLTTEKGKLEHDLGVKSKEITDLRTESDRVKLLNEKYKKRISHHQDEFAKQSKEIIERQVTFGQEIEQLKSEKAELAIQKDQLEMTKNRQLEESNKECLRYKQLYAKHKTLGIQIDKEKEQLKKEIDLKNKQLIELQKASDMDISKQKAEIQLAYNKELNGLRMDLSAKTKQLINIQSKRSIEQQVEMEKLKDTIKTLNEQNARQSKDIVVLTQNLTASQSQVKQVEAKEEIESLNTNRNDVSKETELSAGGIASTAAVNSNGNDNEEINQLKGKLKMLDQRLDFMSGELNKEISKSTQLEVEKLKLQSYVDCLKNEIPFSTHEYKVVQTTPNNSRYITQKSDDVSPFTSMNMRRREHGKESTNNSIVILNYPRQNLMHPLVSTIMRLGDNMNVAVDRQDIEKANVMGGEGRHDREQSETISLYVQFKTTDMKVKFLTNQHKLTMGMVKIREFFDKNT